MAQILVIDDSSSSLDLIRQILTQAGHVAFLALEGRQGLDLLRRQAVDLIITDIIMPETDGFEVLTQAQRAHPSIPIIAISAQPPGLKLLPMAKALGAGVTLQKPFSARALQHAVDLLLKVKKPSPSAEKGTGPKESGGGEGREMQLEARGKVVPG